MITLWKKNGKENDFLISSKREFVVFIEAKWSERRNIKLIENITAIVMYLHSKEKEPEKGPRINYY